MPKPISLTRDILLAALAGFQLDKQRIDTQIAEVQAMLGSGGSRETTPSVSDGTPKKGTRKKFSAVSRRKMALAQKARWAAIKGTSEQPEPGTPEPAKAKRKKMSASARKAIGEATRQRWATKRAAEATNVTPAKRAKKAPAKKTA